MGNKKRRLKPSVSSSVDAGHISSGSEGVKRYSISYVTLVYSYMWAEVIIDMLYSD